MPFSWRDLLTSSDRTSDRLVEETVASHDVTFASSASRVSHAAMPQSHWRTQPYPEKARKQSSSNRHSQHSSGLSLLRHLAKDFVEVPAIRHHSTPNECRPPAQRSASSGQITGASFSGPKRFLSLRHKRTSTNNRLAKTDMAASSFASEADGQIAAGVLNTASQRQHNRRSSGAGSNGRGQTVTFRLAGSQPMPTQLRSIFEMDRHDRQPMRHGCEAASSHITSSHPGSGTSQMLPGSIWLSECQAKQTKAQFGQLKDAFGKSGNDAAAKSAERAQIKSDPASFTRKTGSIRKVWRSILAPFGTRTRSKTHLRSKTDFAAETQSRQVEEHCKESKRRLSLSFRRKHFSAVSLTSKRNHPLDAGPTHNVNQRFVSDPSSDTRRGGYGLIGRHPILENKSNNGNLDDGCSVCARNCLFCAAKYFNSNSDSAPADASSSRLHTGKGHETVQRRTEEAAAAAAQRQRGARALSPSLSRFGFQKKSSRLLHLRLPDTSDAHAPTAYGKSHLLPFFLTFLLSDSPSFLRCLFTSPPFTFPFHTSRSHRSHRSLSTLQIFSCSVLSLFGRHPSTFDCWITVGNAFLCIRLH